MKSLIDPIGQTHYFETTPKRIVCLVPSLTETLYDLGLEVSIVGITKFCEQPIHFRSTKKIVGGTKKVHLDRIINLQPDIIIANKEENSQEIVKLLQTICPVWVTDIKTFEDSLNTIADFGIIFDKRTEARKWINKIEFAKISFQNSLKNKKTLKVAYFIWANPYMVAGNKTFINEMLKVNQLQNIYATSEFADRYPEIEIKKIRIQGDPDLIFLSSEPFPFKDENAFEIGRYSHHAKVMFVDGAMFSWYGTRLYKAFQYFSELQKWF